MQSQQSTDLDRDSLGLPADDGLGDDFEDFDDEFDEDFEEEFEDEWYSADGQSPDAAQCPSRLPPR